jgi:hypothetical protein
VRRNFKIIFNVQKIGKKQFKVAEIRDMQEICFFLLQFIDFRDFYEFLIFFFQEPKIDNKKFCLH